MRARVLVARPEAGSVVQFTQSVVIYESNPKHKDPWQPGRKGSLCPAGLKPEVSQALLEKSEIVEGRRYATWEGRAFCGLEHAAGRWHGFPVGWSEVPERLRRAWRSANLVSRTQIDRFWRSSEDTP